ncbi:MAG: non-hydrolyzing UDP-N-acetylglucosamine 2-epimerase [Pseudonocardia sp.]
MSRPNVALVVGTRPEAVKMAPLVDAVRAAGLLEPVLVATGQHPTMVAQALDAFGLAPDVVLRLHRRSGDQAELVAQLAPALDGVLVERGSAAVVVQGDTTSALLGGLVAFWRQVPVVHLEAGLRSGDLAAPFPEEANRRILGVLADLHLAPTARAERALLAEGTSEEKVLLVGNTVVDAVLQVAATAGPGADPRLVMIEREVSAGDARLLLVTAHRRESWGVPLDRVLAAVEQVLTEHPDLRCVLPAHANPAVRAQVDRALGAHPRVTVTDPLPYPQLCRLLARSALVLSDSGGIQEEAPSFGVPVLVLREVTERMEAVEGGWAELVGTDPARIVAAAKEALAGVRARPTGGNPFGDGHAARRAAQGIAWMLGLDLRPVRFDTCLAAAGLPAGGGGRQSGGSG